MKHTMIAAVALGSVLAATAAGAAGVDDEIKAARAEIASNSVNRKTSCRYYMAWYRELCTEAEREAILERNIAAHKRIIELYGGNAKAPLHVKSELGIVLAIGGRYEEAERILKETIEAVEANPGKLDYIRLSEARWALAECLWRKGDRDGAKKLVSDIATMPWNGKVERTSPRAKAMFLHNLWTDTDADIDIFNLPHSTDCRPFPDPQEATYGEMRVSLAKVEIKAKGLRDESGARGEGSHASRDSHVAQDPIIRLLKRKLSRFGSTFAPGGTPILLEISPNAPVDKPQGYSLDVVNGKVLVKARTRLGLTYGVVSLIQCVDREKLAVAECSIRDWPKLEKRGLIAHWELGHLEYELFSKMSSINLDMFRPEWGVVFSPLDREVVRRSVERRNDFGIEVRWGCRWIIVSPMLPLSSPRVRALHLAWMKYAAAIGSGVWCDLDDERFYPYKLHPLDVKNAGTATNLDAKYFDGLYKEVKAEYPDFKMTFGPPYYFGPDGGLDSDWYPEPRDPYLKSIGDFMDPEIDVYWTGPRVKSHKFTVEKIKWFSNLVKRKQVIFHNADAVGRHGYRNYGADVSGYKKSHCPETLDMIGGFYRNTSFYWQACAAISAMDWCWNPVAHDAERAARRTLDQLEGPGVFEILAAAIPEISYLDKYPGGKPRSELFTEDPEYLDKIAADGTEAWNKVLAIAKNGGKFVEGFKINALDGACKLAKYRRDPPKWLIEKRDSEMANTSFAKEEVGFDEAKGDKFFPAELLKGGFYYSSIRDESKRAPCASKELRIGETVSGRFTIELFPPEEPPKLIVVGQAMVEYWDKSFKVELPETELDINGQTVWRGKMFADGLYKPCEIKLPVYALQRDNTFTIRYTGPDVEHKRRPMIHYVVIRK